MESSSSKPREESETSEHKQFETSMSESKHEHELELSELELQQINWVCKKARFHGTHSYGTFIPEIMTEFEDRKECKSYILACGWRYDGKCVEEPRDGSYVFWPKRFFVFGVTEGDVFANYTKIVKDCGKCAWFVRDADFVVPASPW